MFLLGMTKFEIAEELNKREVMTPALYKKTHNLGYTKPKKDPWSRRSLHQVAYIRRATVPRPCR